MAGVPDPKKKKTARWQDRREEIIRMAESVIAEQGYSSTRLEEIARGLGMRRPSLIYYFENKQALFEAVLDDIFSDLYEIVEKNRDQGTPEICMEAIISDWILFLGRRPKAGQILFRLVGDGLRDFPPHAGGQVKQILDAFSSIMGGDDIDEGFQPLGIVHHAMITAGTPLMLTTAQPILKAFFNFDPLSEENLELHRQVMKRISREVLCSPPKEQSE